MVAHCTSTRDNSLERRRWALRARYMWVSYVVLALPQFGSTSYCAGVTFDHDVMAVLSKAGCNAGACHGNLNGKGGLRLSLRGQDPQSDYFALVSDLAARRINRVVPQQSLILLKSTAQVPHEGGRRFAIDSDQYDILARWITAGAPPSSAATPQLERLEVTPTESILIEPEDQVQLQVTAVFSDGQARDVTSLAVYEVGNLAATVTSTS